MTYFDCGNSRRRRPEKTPRTAADSDRRRSRWPRSAWLGHSENQLPPIEEAFSKENLLCTFDHLTVEIGQLTAVEERTARTLSRRGAARLLGAVSKSVLAGTYRPDATPGDSIPNRSGSARDPFVGGLFDHVVAEQLHDMLSPRFDSLFLHNRHSSRHRWEALAALEAAMHVRDAWVVTPEEIHDPFEHVCVETVLDDLGRVILDRKYRALIGAVLRGWLGSNTKGRRRWECLPALLALDVHLHYHHDHAVAADGIPYWVRFRDKLAYVTQDESDGRRARERAADLLQQVGLTLAGPGTPINLSEGNFVQYLGVALRLHDGAVQFEASAETYAELETLLTDAKELSDPPYKAGRAVGSFVFAFAPAFENDAGDWVSHVLGLADSHGFGGVITEEEVRDIYRAALRQWTTVKSEISRKIGR